MSKLAFFFSCLFSLGFATSNLTAVSQTDLPEPYRSITLLPYDPQGWFFNSKQMEYFIKNRKVNTVIEVGSWLGQSTRYIADLLPSGGKVYAIDHWKGSIEHLAWPGLNRLYGQFLSNAVHAGLTDKIIPIRMESLEAAKALSVQADLIYIDASHDTDNVIADIMAWYPRLKADGLMCGDDWTWDSVRVAVETCAPRLGKKIYSEENFWCLVD